MNSHVPLPQVSLKYSVAASPSSRAVSSLTIKDGSIVLHQQVLVREEIEVVHQGAGHKERQGPLERRKPFFELPKSTPRTEVPRDLQANGTRSPEPLLPGLTFFSRHTMLV